jgi:hypothetical protein
MAKANGISSLSKSAASPRSRMGRKDGMGAPSVDMQSTSPDATSSIGLRSPIGLQSDYTIIPTLLDHAHDTLDPNSALRSTIITPMSYWNRKFQSGFLNRALIVIDSIKLKGKPH